MLVQEFFNKVQENLSKEIGEVKLATLSTPSEESTWLTWNNKKIVETVGGIPFAFLPEDQSYNLFFFPIKEDVVKLQYIEVIETNKGLGTKILNCILDAADEVGIKIEIFSSPFKSKYANISSIKTPRSIKKLQMIDNWRLINWYRDFGFKSISKKTPYKLEYN